MCTDRCWIQSKCSAAQHYSCESIHRLYTVINLAKCHEKKKHDVHIAERKGTLSQAEMAAPYLLPTVEPLAPQKCWHARYTERPDVNHWQNPSDKSQNHSSQISYNSKTKNKLYRTPNDKEKHNKYTTNRSKKFEQILCQRRWWWWVMMIIYIIHRDHFTRRTKIKKTHLSLPFSTVPLPI